MRAHTIVKPPERDEVRAAAVSLSIWKQWEQGTEDTRLRAPHLWWQGPSCAQGLPGMSALCLLFGYPSHLEN